MLAANLTGCATVVRVAIPRALAWLFPEHDVSTLDPKRDAWFVLARILEQGRLEDVRWCVARYGLSRIHAFLRDEGHPEVSERTRSLWRVALRAEGETWAPSGRSVPHSAAPWLD